MAEFQRPPGWRFAFGGVNLRSVADALAPNKYACALNVRATSDESVRTRPGVQVLFASTVHQPITDIRAYATLGTDDKPRYLARDVNNNIILDSGTPIATLGGTPGLGVSMLPFRPASSPQAWMYIASQGDYQKISAPDASNVVVAQKVGIAEPQLPCESAPAAPSFYDFTAAAANWTAGGTAGAPADGTRSSEAAGTAIADPIIATRFSVGVGSATAYQVGELTTFGATKVEVQDVIPPISPLTITGIYYFSGTTGRCIINPSQLPLGQVPPGQPQLGFLRRGALVLLNSSETVLVLKVIPGPNGSLAFETSTAGTFSIGQTITGIPTIVVDGASTGTIAATEVTSTITAGIGYLTQNLGANPFNAIPLQQDDYVHVSLNVGDPTQVTEIQVQFNVDAADLSFTQNYLYYSIDPSVLSGVVTGLNTQTSALQNSAQNTLTSNQVAGLPSAIAQLQRQISAAPPYAIPSLNQQLENLQSQLGSAPSSPSAQTTAGFQQWTEVYFPISSLTRIGNDQTRTLANCNAVRIWINTTGAGSSGWTPNTAYSLGQEILDPSGHTQKVTTAGISGTTEPTWNDAGGTTADGSVVWTDQGSGVSATTTLSFSSMWTGGGSQPDIGDAGIPYQYLGVPRSSLTGARGNPTASMYYGVKARRQAVKVVLPSAAYDSQINTWDVYRYGGTITSYRYIGSIPSSNSGTVTFTDNYFDDTAKAGDPVVQTNFEPWPSIDVPYRSPDTSTVAVFGNIITITDATSAWPATITRWLPGTLIQIAGQQTFTLRYRPTAISGTKYMFVVQECVGYSASIGTFWVNEPNVARQPVPYMDGPDANGTFFAVGDQLRPGVVYMAAPYQPDSAPQSTTLELCSPSEPLMRPVVLQTITLVASTKRWWSLYVNFNNPGSGYAQIEQPVGRAPVSPYGVCTDGERCFFWTKDGIAATSGGPFQSLTDADMYPLFPHEGVQGEDIVRNGVTFYAPDYSRAAQFRIAYVNKYLFCDYPDSTGTYRTLVCDLRNGAWSQDQYGSQVTVHYAPEQQAGTILSSGTLYQAMVVADTAGEVSQEGILTNDSGAPISCVLATFEWDGGDQRAWQQFGDMYLDCLPRSAVTVTPVSQGVGAAAATVIPQSSSRAFTPISLQGALVIKYLGLQLSWTETSDLATTLYLWQPSVDSQPEIITDRFGEWTLCGTPKAKFFQGVLMHIDTYNQAKSIQVRDTDSDTLHVLQPALVTANGEQVLACSFATPFIAHEVRDESLDALPWRKWSIDYIWQETPESVQSWITQGTAHGLKGYQSILRLEAAWSSIEQVLVTITAYDGTSPQTILLESTGGAYRKKLITPTFNKGQLYTYSVTSASPCRLFFEDWIVWVAEWGRQGMAMPYRNLGGSFGDKATI